MEAAAEATEAAAKAAEDAKKAYSELLENKEEYAEI